MAFPRSLQEDDEDAERNTCPCPSEEEEDGVFRPQTVQMLSPGGPDAYLDFIANRFRSRAALFKERTGHTVETVGLGDELAELTQEILADVDAKVYDGYVFLPFLAGSVLEKGGLADLTEFVRTNQDVRWPDIFPFNREVQAVFDHTVRLLPCDGDVHSLYYRKDLFDDYNIAVPRTWDEYTEAAKFFHGMEVPSANASATNETVTLTGSCVGRKPSCLDFGFFNVLVHSTQSQAGGTRKGSLLDPRTFQPLLGEALAETLRHLENQIRYGAPDELTYEQCSGLNIERMNTMGNCAMTYHWGDVFARHLLPDSVVEGKLGIATTPGSTKVLDRTTGQMVDCTEELCPYGTTYSDIGRVNYAPYAAAGGWSVGVSAGTTPARQKAMADFFGMVCGEEVSLEDVIPNSTGPTFTGTDPYRRSHFDIDTWVARGYPEDTTRLYKDTITTSLSSENTVLDIRFPDADKFLKVMHDKIFLHLNESRTEDKTFDDRIQVARDIEAEWAKLETQYNQRDTTVFPLKTIYQQSLSVYVPPALSSDKMNSGAIAGIAVGAALFAALVTGVFLLWTLWRERKKNDILWLIKKEDIQLSSEVIGEGSFGVILKGTIRGTTVAVKPSQHDWKDGFIGRESLTGYAGRDGPTSKALAHLETTQTDETEASPPTNALKFSHRQVKEDLSALVKLRNPHICSTLGAMIDRRTIFVIFEYMENGNLSQVLGDPAGVAGSDGSSFELQWALQIAKGLQFLHSIPEPLGPLLHEDLKASNVLCDGSYNARLSNFALESRVVGSRRDQGSLLWTAPEVLNGEKPSEASDVYSFGMLLFEIVARARPFRVRRFSRSNLTTYTVSTISNPDDDIMPSTGVEPNSEYFGSIDGEKLTVPEIISRVSDTMLEPAVRPQLPKESHVLLRDLCVECWNKNPDRRPGLTEVVRRLSSGSNLTQNLAKRTKLFDSILPHHVQDKLSRNEPVPPQNYENVTVIFSDIVNFTSTSSKLTAAEVGDLISRLFTKYDELAEKYGVKKLDVIGDAFLGVTNLPDETPDHAPRAAGFALEAIHAAQQTPICPSKPSLGTVNIRFGLATGPVVASVIGSSKYPKFTLFGTTVNTASRMESSSLPGRVQCTKETAVLIQKQQPAIEVEPRGKMEIKGRGQLDTFFLNGNDFKLLSPAGSRSSKLQARHSMGDILVGKEANAELTELYGEASVELTGKDDDEEQGMKMNTA
ncbi:Receptor-type guanylate cyclase gcy [Seminavis robusta]|uniref:guanylate cyclase n=1 Tax=Seminavis robusta TaxID=568900 RepID=A0A9N8EAI6_9STRA|nr:Receptor-type guanylate cyclase gcy [Seminavis robusta]|eukprot:Sro886_g216200.1 Receptor-type guanylate cyclase gcy (1215) ;mRNA; f:22953-27134